MCGVGTGKGHKKCGANCDQLTQISWRGVRGCRECTYNQIAYRMSLRRSSLERNGYLGTKWASALRANVRYWHILEAGRAVGALALQGQSGHF